MLDKPLEHRVNRVPIGLRPISFSHLEIVTAQRTDCGGRSNSDPLASRCPDVFLEPVLCGAFVHVGALTQGDLTPKPLLGSVRERRVDVIVPAPFLDALTHPLDPAILKTAGSKMSSDTTNLRSFEILHCRAHTRQGIARHQMP